MRDPAAANFAKELFERHHDAQIKPAYPQWHSVNAPGGELLAVLGCRGAAEGPLFLESYIPQPIERILSDRFGTAIDRSEIVEIGCFAATPSPALIRLWHDVAKRLGEEYVFAVATLTAPLRDYLSRLGLPLIAIRRASQARLCDSDERWGRYYEQQPWVCAGIIAQGEEALARYARRLRCR